jgi:hypothetical protein
MASTARSKSSMTGQPLDDVRATVHREDFGAAAGQFEGECGAEAAQADDRDGILAASQRWSSPREAGDGGHAARHPAAADLDVGVAAHLGPQHLGRST